MSILPSIHVASFMKEEGLKGQSRSPEIKRNDLFFAAQDSNGTNVLTRYHEE
ncbi:hypothetical protein DPMN_090398 [Dreissena polymorpha]|uniref:Uncharacterized protein n=1 Tax=Dreissena polymorpha TaxID=45954 RepID=A0A9D4QZR4_DREPO|nr:hypothetical protein DPMN_090398 [Dreissena polymorpha]